MQATQTLQGNNVISQFPLSPSHYQVFPFVVFPLLMHTTWVQKNGQFMGIKQSKYQIP
jgi:hypothetical protein